MRTVPLFCTILTSMNAGEIGIVTCTVDTYWGGICGTVLRDGKPVGNYKLGNGYKRPLYFPNGYNGEYISGSHPMIKKIKEYLDSSGNDGLAREEAFVDIPF